jgi:hypothetical protein
VVVLCELVLVYWTWWYAGVVLLVMDLVVYVVWCCVKHAFFM